MSDPGLEDRPPETGDGAIDQALQELVALPETPLDEHHDRLARVHEVLHGALDRTDDAGHP